LDIPPQ